MKNDIYTDIATRTGGDIYIGVVGLSAQEIHLYKAVHGAVRYTEH